MLNTKRNIRNKKITEALQATVTGTDPMLFLEMLGNIRDTSNDTIETIDLNSKTSEEIEALYELAEVGSYILNKIYLKVNGIE